VKAQFEVSSINDDGKDPSFELSCSSGVINPGSSYEITVTYSPSIVGMYTNT
jgi:hypothetical protein